MEHEHEGMTRIPDLVIRALEQERSFQALLSETIEQLEASGAMTPALDDLLPETGRQSAKLSQAVGQAAGTLVYVVVFLLALLAIAEILDWDFLRSSLVYIRTLFQPGPTM